MTLHPDLIALESGPPGSQPTLLHVASGRWPARIRAAPFMTIVNTAHFAIAVLAASILALTASRLKLAPFNRGHCQLLDLVLDEHEALELVFEPVEVLPRAIFGAVADRQLQD